MSSKTSDFAARLEVSEEAVAAVRQCDMLDLHIDTFIPMRLWGYDIEQRHGAGVLRGRFAGHLDLPRIEEVGLTGAMWSVTTNPFRTRGGRWKTVHKNFKTLRSRLEDSRRVRIVSNHHDYIAARDSGVHVGLLSIQGGNALDDAPDGEFLPDPDLLRVTLVHLTNSLVGRSSSPFQFARQEGLTPLGMSLVERLNQHRVFVDLAHISKEGFWKALEVHDRTQPFLVTHTGVESVTPHWRNIDDDQIRAVAASGGVVGIMFHKSFVKRPGVRDCSVIVDHMEHVIDVVGEDYVAIGSDYDGAITPPRDIRSGDSYPRLIQIMLERGWSGGRIEKVLGGNFLRALAELRPRA